MIFLDTNIVSKAMRRSSASLDKRLIAETKANNTLHLSVIVKHELWLAIKRSPTPDKALVRVKTFLSIISSILPFDEDDSKVAASIRADLMAQGLIISPYDVLIAAQALRRDALLVTNNVREFSRIKGLRWEDWSAD